jgi:ribonuclease P protein component
MRKSAGPLTLFSRPNGKGWFRLGLAIGKRVGDAPARNRVKRLLREAFRLTQHEMPLLATEPPMGLDVVLSAHAHQDLGLEGAQKVLMELVAQSVQAWEKRRDRDEPRAGGKAGGSVGGGT